MEEKRRVLIVDPSRVARAALAKHLSAEYDLREESDGESAWQTLVLDPSIVAVVAALNLGKCDGHALLQRLRTNRLHRLSDLPFFLLISENESQANRVAAKERGVSDFIVRGMSGDEILQHIGRLVNWDVSSSIMPPVAGPSTVQAFAKRPAMCRRLCDEMDRHSNNPEYSAVVLAFGLTQEQMLRQRFGAAAVEDLGRRVADLIHSKINGRDAMALGDGTTCLIASPGTTLATAHAFAQRVCRALGEQAIRVGKERLQISVSAGLASLPVDTGRTASQLIDLALARLEQARHSPGNLVVSAADPERVDPLSSLHSWQGTDAANQRLAQAGLDMLPLMRLLEAEFNLGLPLEQMEGRFRQHVSLSANTTNN